MEIENLISVQTREELRAWLEEHSQTEKFCWVLLGNAEQADRLQYLDAVEEALCFGWIDSTKKKLPDTGLAQRLSPRSKKSNWTELNKERVRRLEKLGLMTDDGRKVLPDMRPESFIIDEDIESRLKEDEQVYRNFLNFPELYSRIRIDTIQSTKKDPAVFNARLEKFIENTRANKIYGQWNDNGRLHQLEEKNQ
ncbi:YdeI/OmpD-associated family protein [Planococcus halotolerans]|uniref:YdeI/OmpD-associated family protein n=1 Tax=Planococcus halotolerans TaxID=2233542 RepID=UPI0010922CBA|nr:YdeI/OmpD-associated family protein [Planococcus halotolerans]QHJ69796.1 thymidylate synthase [Planococcus halotolerans]